MKIVIPKNTNAVNVATNYVVLADNSGSMWYSIDDLKKTFLAVGDLVGPKDTITLGYFSSYGDYDFFVRGASLQDKNLSKIIDEKVRARGLTCFTQSLGKVSEIVKDVASLTGNNNFAFYFLSDGYPNDRSPESEVYKLSASLKPLFASSTVVGYGSYYGRSVLLEMANKLGGQMAHVSDYKEMSDNYRTFFSGGKATRKNVALERKYDLVWQVSDVIEVLEQSADNSVNVKDTTDASQVYAFDYKELPALKHSPDGILRDPQFVYSLAYVFSQQNKANLGVSLLRQANDLTHSKMLQKAFTVSQKGRAENQLLSLATTGSAVFTEVASEGMPLKTFLKNIDDNLGHIFIDLKKSKYNSISRKGNDVSKVEFKVNDGPAKITEVISNENRSNLSFQTVREGQLIKVNDKDLAKRIKDFNKTTKGKKIEFPIDSVTFRNYAFIANGDYNFEKFVLVRNGVELVVNPEKDLDVFDETVKSYHIKDFTNLTKALLEEKAHASVLAYYIKNNSTQKHADDLRVNQYGAEAVPLLEELGLDYQLRYAPKRESTPKDENADYVSFVELKGQLVGASSISAKDSYEKYLKDKDPNAKKPKQNPGDAICWPLFEKYDKLKNTLDKEVFVKTLQTAKKGVDSTVDVLSRELSQMKFFVVTTNSWFEGVDKQDEFEFDGVKVKVTEQKEYL